MTEDRRNVRRRKTNVKKNKCKHSFTKRSPLCFTLCEKHFETHWQFVFIVRDKAYLVIYFTPRMTVMKLRALSSISSNTSGHDLEYLIKKSKKEKWRLSFCNVSVSLYKTHLPIPVQCAHIVIHVFEVLCHTDRQTEFTLRWFMIIFFFRFCLCLLQRIQWGLGGEEGRRRRCYERRIAKTWGDRNLSHTRWSVITNGPVYMCERVG